VRILLIADVHANWPALLALQRAEPEPDALLFAGDAVGYGPDPAACAGWLLAHSRAAVRGDHDAALAEGQPALPSAPPELAEAAEETLAWSRQQLPPDQRAGLCAWPLTGSICLGGASFFLCHGLPARPLDGRLHPAAAREAELRRHFNGVEADVIVLGHTHVPALRRLGPQLIVNPGSLGQPRHGLPEPTYAVWDDGNVQIRHLHYDHGLVAQRLRLAPLGPETLDVLSHTLESGLVPGWAG
jgi:putative phosphoesterase